MTGINHDKLIHYLRNVAPGLRSIGIDHQDAAMLADAIEIADSCARSDIECNCVWVGDNDENWWDLGNVDHYWPIEDEITQAARYLDARGLLVRRPTNRDHVTFKK